MKKIRKWGRSAPERPQQADERQPPEQMRRCGERHRTRLRILGRILSLISERKRCPKESLIPFRGDSCPDSWGGW